jgi:hypothetical protein
MPARITLFAVLLAVLSGTAATATTESIPQYQRAYLLSDDGLFSYWSFDPDEITANTRRMTRTCPATAQWNPCYGGADGERYWQFAFNPHSVLEQAATWNAERPLRYHLEMEVDIPVPFSVRVGVLSFTQGIQFSGPATEVAPGVWEGSITAPNSLSTTSSKQLAIRITYTDPPTGPAAPVTIDLQTGGRSYVELPDPVPAWSLTDLVGENPMLPASSFKTALRELTFNDSEWEAFEFQGDLAQAREFTAHLPRKAVGVMGFVEGFSEPLLHDLIRNGHAAPEQLTDAPITSLQMNGNVIASGANSTTENAGRGTDSAAATNVGPGDLTLRVARNNYAQTSFPYKAYIVAIYGERTLRSYRAEYAVRNSIQTPQVRTPAAGACSHFSERVPVSASSRAISAEIDVDTVNPAQRWTLAYGQPGLAFYPCGESGTGHSVTVTKQSGALVFDSGVTLANGGVVSYHNRDAVIDELVRVYYRPEVAAG